MSQEPLMECAYDWGKVFRIYRDHVQVHDTIYTLSDLLSVQPTYNRFMGVSSARLVLRFKQQVVTLRGIAEVDSLRQAVVFLHAHVAQADNTTGPITEHTASLRNTCNIDNTSSQQWESRDDLAQAPTRPIATPSIQPQRPRHTSAAHEREQRTQGQHQDRSLREHRSDVKLLVQRLKEGPLPTVPVPLRLQHDEYALYATPATICQEVRDERARAAHEPKDQGMLIFTSKRLIYLGRTSQLITDYTHLVRVSYQQKSIAIITEHWLQREVFEVRRPLECSVYLEAIMECFREQYSSHSMDQSIIPAYNSGHDTTITTYEAERPLFAEAFAHTNAVRPPVAVTDWNVAEEF